MDYLQTLESQMAALQRKIRLLQDLRFFLETASPDELAGFGDELRSIVTSSGTNVGSALSALLGAPVVAAPGRVPARPGGPNLLPAARSGPASPPEAGPEPEAAPELEAAPESASPADRASAPGALEGLEASMKAIPAGSFIMGSEAADDEKPPRKVELSAYRICDHLVTNKEYSLFVAANPQWSRDRADPELRDGRYLDDWQGGSYPEGKDDHPVAYVSWFAAEAFAAWLGKRLPTEAEWECAARGGLVGKKYPNGDLMNDKLANLAKQYRGTTPVRQFEPNGFGLFDMAGNLFEWTSDWYGPYGAGRAEGPQTGERRVARGGSWMSGAGALRVSARVDMEPRSCGQAGIRLAG
jgi:formylglycine-generating enzyme required for sulfatase activity